MGVLLFPPPPVQVSSLAGLELSNSAVDQMGSVLATVAASTDLVSAQVHTTNPPLPTIGRPCGHGQVQGWGIHSRHRPSGYAAQV
jgi:hypothetical protein